MASTVAASVTGRRTWSSLRRVIRRWSTSHSSSADGYPKLARIMNRSSCASGSGYVPSYSTGLAVARTWNGGGSTKVSPSTVIWCSCIASSSAAWVRGGVRLISSARSNPANSGPFRKANSLLRWSYTNEPVRSAGSRSGVNWAREKSRPSVCANERAASVLPRPGKSSSSTWPPARTAARTRVRASRLPTTAISTSSSTSFARRETSPAPSCGADSGSRFMGLRSELFDQGEDAVEGARSGAGGGVRGVVDESLEFVADDGTGGVGVGRTVDLVGDAELVVDHGDQALVELLEHQ